jgi:hypothetical protein
LSTSSTLSAEANSIPFIHARGNFDLQRARFPDLAVPIAVRARILDRTAAAATGRTGLLDRENTLLHPNLALTAAGGANIKPTAFGSAAVASAAFAQGGNTNFFLDTLNGFLKLQFELVAKVLTSSGLLSPAAAAAENIAKDVSEDIVDVSESTPARRSGTSATVNAGMAESIIGSALLFVFENLVGFLDFFEARFRVGL